MSESEQNPKQEEMEGKTQEVKKRNTERTGLGKVTDAVSEQIEQKLNPYIEKVMPFIKMFLGFIDTLQPYVERAYQLGYDLWKKLEPYHPEELVDVLFGLFVCFFGGMYLTILATVEAYRMCGWSQTKGYILDLYADYCVVKEASDKDDLVDDNNDGIPDVQQISKKQLASRKIKLILKSCNPEKVIGALSGIYMGFMAVMATLRIQFAQAITLGTVIGDIFQKTADKYVSPLLMQLVPTDYRKWVPVIIKYICRTTAVSIAWFIQRVMSAFYSAFRGANFFAHGAMKFAGRNGYTAPFEEGSIIVTGVVTVVALLGFYWQISSGFSLPFPLSFIMFPFTLIEYWLTYMVNFSTDLATTAVAA